MVRSPMKPPGSASETRPPAAETMSPVDETRPPIEETMGVEPAADALPAFAQTSYPIPVRTKDRDPAHREAWKRERAKALGHDRH